MIEQIKKIEIGKKYFDSLGCVTVICFVDKKYLVAKRKGCIPFISSLNKFSKRFRNKEDI